MYSWYGKPKHLRRFLIALFRSSIQWLENLSKGHVSHQLLPHLAMNLKTGSRQNVVGMPAHGVSDPFAGCVGANDSSAVSVALPRATAAGICCASQDRSGEPDSGVDTSGPLTTLPQWKVPPKTQRAAKKTIWAGTSP